MSVPDPGTNAGLKPETLHEIATMFEDLGRQLKPAAGETPFDALAKVTLHHIDGAQSASITTYRHNRYRTVAATDELARLADHLQYELGSGPCLDAIVEGTVYHPTDLRHDDRWPHFAKRVNEELGVASMLSLRLNGDFAAEEMIAGLNLYSDRPRAFTASQVELGHLLATHGGVAVAAELNRDRAGQFEQALATNREIGVAIGVLMARHHLTREQAFDMLRLASQRLNRKLRDIAVEVGDTGALPGMLPRQDT